MSLTGLNLRHRLKRRVVSVLDTLIALLDDEADASAETAPAPPPDPAPAPAPASPPGSAAPAPRPTAAPTRGGDGDLPPLPDVPKALKPLPGTHTAPKPAAPRHNGHAHAAEDGPATPAETPARPKKKVSADTPAKRRMKEAEAKADSPEDRQKRHWDRTRKGVLRFVHDKGGLATLREMHEYSESTFFVAHVGFSRLMEELTDEGLLDYDHDTAEARITDAGRAEIL